MTRTVKLVTIPPDIFKGVNAELSETGNNTRAVHFGRLSIERAAAVAVWVGDTLNLLDRPYIMHEGDDVFIRPGDLQCPK